MTIGSHMTQNAIGNFRISVYQNNLVMFTYDLYII